MIPVCDWCGGYIDNGDRAHRGYCCGSCKRQATHERDQYLSRLAEARADAARRRTESARGRRWSQ